MHLIAATTVAWLVYFVVLNAAARLIPLFDASPRLVHPSLWPLVRWDSFHFVAIANDGYRYEHQWAFLPATPFLVSLVPLPWWPLALLGLACASTTTLYKLTLHHFPASPSLARLTALTALLPSSSPTLYFAPYAEPFFTFLSYKGMCHYIPMNFSVTPIHQECSMQHKSNGFLPPSVSPSLLPFDQTVFSSAATSFGASSSIRFSPARRSVPSALPTPSPHRPILVQTSLSRITYAAVLAATVATPFVYHSYLAYQLFCTPTSSVHPPPWCSHHLPSIYTYVQSKYWNVGFLRYWSLPQIPNFLIATPPLMLLLAFSFHHLVWAFFPLLRFRFLSSSSLPHVEPTSPFLTSTITPHIIHTIFISFTLLFFSHTQIILRLAAALPTIYWAAAWLLVVSPKKPWARCASLWLWWSVLWSFISVGLWAAFMPPA